MELKRNDNDTKKVWGGSKLEKTPGYTVKNLQTDLTAVGVYSDVKNGNFGKNTERGLKIFQWCIKNSTTIIKNKANLAYMLKPTIKVDGKLNSATLTALKDWVKNQYTVTGDLVRVNSDNLPNIDLGPGFKHIGKPIVTSKEIVISKAAYKMLKLMSDAAKTLKVTIKINQALRLHGVKVTGSVVPPASKSQHLIGHAIDCNIVDGTSWNSSKDFKKKQQTENAKKFIKAMKLKSYRWGGNFSNVDSPHFDSQVNADTFDYDAKFYLNQKQLSSGAPIEKQLITK